MPKPMLWHRMCAAMTGEVSADTLEAYRRASLAVYDALSHCESHRQSAKEDGMNAWTLAPATKAEILCTWNAFVLQTLGDYILDTDYQNDPLTRGFVPPATADQVLRFYGQVEGWLNRAQQAHYNPDYQLDIGVPAELPAWSEVEPRPSSLLQGMLEALHVVRDHTAAAMLFLNDSLLQNSEQKRGLNIIRQVHAAATTKARYATDMMTAEPTLEVQDRVAEHAKAAMEYFYLLGQLLAMPELAVKLSLKPSAVSGLPTAKTSEDVPPGTKTSVIEGPAPPFYTPSPALFSDGLHQLPLPGEVGFDIWCLTDADAVEHLWDDREAVRALKLLWSLDPNPRLTLEIQAEINAALQRGDIAYATDRYGKKLGHFLRTPWSSVYLVYRSVTLGGRRLYVMEQFVFNVSCDGVNTGVPFVREIMTGNFVPTARLDYSDPDAEPDGAE